MSERRRGRRLSALRLSFRLVLHAGRRRSVAILVILGTSALSTAAIAVCMRWLVNGAVTHQLALVVVAGVVGSCAHAISSSGRLLADSVLRIEVTERAELALQREIESATASMDTIAHLERPEYLDRITILQRSRYSIVTTCWSVAELTSVAVSLVLSTVLLIAVHPVLVLVAGLAVPSLLLARRGTHWVRRSIEVTAVDVRAEQHLHDLATEPATAKELLVAGCGPELDRRAGGIWRRTTRARTRAATVASLLELGGWAIFTAGYVAALVFVVHLVLAGERKVGDLILVITLVSGLRQQVAECLANVGKVARGLHAMDNLLWLRDYAARHRGGAGAEPPNRLSNGIRLAGVGFRYPGTDIDRLHDVDLHLPAGRTVALVGENGAGKTTLVKLLFGLYTATRGRIFVDGVDLTDLRPHRWRECISAVNQDFVRFELLVRQTVGIGRLPMIDDPAAVRAALDRAEATDFVSALPAGPDTPLGGTSDGVDLSGGQWQRLALARGCMRPAPLLLVLDEPTASLDPRSEHLLYQKYHEQARQLGHAHGTVTVFVSHRFSTVSMADLIVVFDGGRIVEQGSHQELLGTGGTYAQLYRAQAASYADRLDQRGAVDA